MREYHYKRIIAALLANPTVNSAAESLKMSPNEVEKCLKDPVFKHAYLAAQDAVLTHVTGYLTNTIGEMSKLLLDMANDNRLPHQIRLNAIKVVFEYSVKFTETNNVLQRIKNLEDECGVHGV